MKTRSAWLWVPTLYFAEGLPYFIVNTISLILFKDLGMENGKLALLTSLISLPWLLKPLWSPFVDILKSKRWWILSMQALMAVTVGLIAVTVPEHSPFTLTLILFTIAAFSSATHDIAADGFYMTGLDQSRQSSFVGIRNTFYRIAMVFGQGVLVMIAGVLQRHTGNVHKAWSLTLGACALLLCAITVYHSFAIPRVEEERPVREGKLSSGFGGAFVSFFTREGVWTLIAFLLLFRLPEAFSVKMLYPFFSDSVELGGLGMSKEPYGLAYGTLGVVALLAGGILGGLHISRKGLKHCMMPMALSLALPCGVYLLMACVQPQSMWMVAPCIILDQFGYGYGFTAYTVYMMRFSQGPTKASHYAICTGFMALSMLLPGAVAGYIQQWLGYTGFFIMVMICCIATICVTLSARRRLPSA